MVVQKTKVLASSSIYKYKNYFMKMKGWWHKKYTNIYKYKYQYKKMIYHIVGNFGEH